MHNVINIEITIRKIRHYEYINTGKQPLDFENTSKIEKGVLANLKHLQSRFNLFLVDSNINDSDSQMDLVDNYFRYQFAELAIDKIKLSYNESSIEIDNGSEYDTLSFFYEKMIGWLKSGFKLGAKNNDQRELIVSRAKIYGLNIDNDYFLNTSN